MMNILGHNDGSSAVDYTVNCAVGYPYATGNAGRDAPVNHVFPGWDAVCGVTASTGILAAERHRRLTGEGQYISLALSDVAYAMVGNFGHIAEAQIKKETRPPCGNDLYGAFGRDFGTRDGKRIMIVAITRRQWSELVKAVGMEDQMAQIAESTGRNLNDEGDRFEARDAIAAEVGPWVEGRTFADVDAAFEGSGVCWGLYQDFVEMVENDPRCSPANPHVPGTRPARDRPLSRAGITPRLRGRTARFGQARAAARREHRRDTDRNIGSRRWPSWRSS